MFRRLSPALVGALLLASPLAHAQTAKSKTTLQAEINSNFPDNTSGAITPAIARATFNDFLASWQQYTAVNAQVGTTYTFVASDYGQLVTFNRASPVAVTLPNPSTTGFNPWNTYVRNLGAGVVTITPTGSNINAASTLVLTTNQSASIVSDGTNYQTWFNSAASGFGPASTTVGDIPLWNNTTGTLLADPGIPLDTSVANAFPGPSDPSQGNVTRGHKVAPLDANVVFGGNGVFPVQVVGSNPYAIGTAGTVASSTVGQIFSVRFTSAFLSGSPITVSYTAVGGDTVSTIGLALCVAVNANATLHNALSSLPAFCQSINQTSPGLFNLQWDVSYSDMAIASVGTGTINFGALNRTLDFAVAILGRRIPGYVGQNGDNIACLQFMGQSTSGSMDAVVGNMCGTLNNATTMTGTVSFSASSANAGHAQFAIATGMLLYDSTGAFPTGGFKGIGTLNIPTTGGLYIAGNSAVQVSTAGAGGAGLVSTGTNAAVAWNATGGGVDSKWWDSLNAGSTLSFRLVNDAQGSATNWMVVTRSAMTVSSVAFPSGHIFMNTTNGGAVTDDIARLNVVETALPNIAATSYGTFSSFIARRADGTSASPTQVLANETIFEFGVRGFQSGGAFGATNTGTIRFNAGENLTAGAQGTYFLFLTTPTGSVTQATTAIFWGSSGISLGGDATDPGAGNVRVAGTVKALSATTSTSSTTGALTSGGGFGAAGAIWAGTYIDTGVVAVASLPACGAGIKGARMFVSDNNTALAFAAVITTGGAIQTPVYCDGTVWRQGANDNIPAHLMRNFA